MTVSNTHTPTTNENVHEVFENIFAPCVKSMGLTSFDVSYGKVSAILPQNPNLQWVSGAICGQVIMSAIDTIVALAMTTSERSSKGTASQNTQFLRPAIKEDLKIETSVLKFGKVISYAETKVSFVKSGKLVAHSTNEFVF